MTESIKTPNGTRTDTVQRMTKKNYSIRITGSGTAEEISQRLYEKAAELYNGVHTIHREDPLEIECEEENETLMIEIEEEATA